MSALQTKLTYASLMGLSPTDTSNKKKIEQIFIRREKSKSNIQMIMNQIYQEEEKNSKIVKYLTHTNGFRSENTKHSDVKLHKILKPKPNSLAISNEMAQNLISIPTSLKLSLKSAESLEFQQDKSKKFDLEIEDPNIINIYQNSLEKPLQKPQVESFFLTNGEFEEELKLKKMQFNRYISSYTDVFARIKKKQDKSEQFSLFNVVEKKKKPNSFNAKEESIKRRFMKVWEKNRSDKMNTEMLNKIETIGNDPFNETNNSSTLFLKKTNWNENKNISCFKKLPVNVKISLKQCIHENEFKPVRKLTYIEKIKEKYNYSWSHRKKLDPEMMENAKKLERTPTKKTFAMIEKIDGIKNEVIHKENVIKEIIPKSGASPQRKFEFFYNDLMDYYKIEMEDRGNVQKDITHQVKVYDDDLRKIKEKLFEFNADLDKDFNKVVYEGGRSMKFTNIRRVKRKK